MCYKMGVDYLCLCLKRCYFEMFKYLIVLRKKRLGFFFIYVYQRFKKDVLQFFNYLFCEVMLLDDNRCWDWKWFKNGSILVCKSLNVNFMNYK